MKWPRMLSALFGFDRNVARHKVTSAKIDAALVAADAVADEARKVNTKLSTYIDQPDPFMALLIDISNERAARAQIRQWDD